ncbi:threonine/homoserine/homoserine lactone efflux protein [Allocatelliglobosispora scoriae]|uniref:Threonine/homoserine/homoserine lactone efflux protein n=1 Tax=Allocatelliglobosispora scoriae TaxID=643052 RepID=A0A841C6A1_9ACTN|nr:LysE family translocator [Allocatelliglobosispora scoriae]MBB5874460.1 threonine/homoserine/homoserine lactone efflux protein [Allocatelliglobosispora scoriae]
MDQLFAAFLVAALVICVTPGPDMVYVISFGVAKGRSGGVAAAFGIALGMLFHTLLAAFGVAAVVSRYPVVLIVLKVIGVAYLCRLGYTLIRDRSAPLVSAAGPPRSLLRIVFSAALVNITNPKIFLFYLAFLPQFTSADAGPVWSQLLVLGGVFVLMGFVTDGVVGLVSGALNARLAAGTALVRRVNVSCGLIMFVLAGVIAVG